jgi:hypothetical protein
MPVAWLITFPDVAGLARLAAMDMAAGRVFTLDVVRLSAILVAQLAARRGVVLANAQQHLWRLQSSCQKIHCRQQECKACTAAQATY